MIQVSYAVLTNPGGRASNEDSAGIRPFPGGLAAALADGLGGQGRGEVASQLAVEEFLRCAGADGENHDGAAIDGEAPDREALDGAALDRAALRANEAVLSGQTAGCRMMTTLVGLVIREDEASWVHVGDSRLYHFHDRKLTRYTQDHSVPQMAVMMGMISEEQIRFHVDRSRILRALGSDSFEPELSKPVSLTDGFHAFLLCSDGFWEYVLEKEMEETLALGTEPDGWLKSMEQILKGRIPSDADNYTAVAVFTMGRK